jgi:hypothetical protein
MDKGIQILSRSILRTVLKIEGVSKVIQRKNKKGISRSSVTRNSIPAGYKTVSPGNNTGEIAGCDFQQANGNKLK